MSVLKQVSSHFPPPQYLAVPTAGVEISISGAKFITLRRVAAGIIIDSFGSYAYEDGVIESGDILKKEVVHTVLGKIKKNHTVEAVNIALPEQKSYLFQAVVPGSRLDSELRQSVQQHVATNVPLPPSQTQFDVSRIQKIRGQQLVAGVAYAQRIVSEYRDVFAANNFTVRAMESEMHSVARALFPKGSDATYMVVDIGKRTTKIFVVQNGEHPVFATTLSIGGHALTSAVQKYFGVTEEEAKVIKRERGIIPDEVDDEYLASMLTTVSAIREEIANRFSYWQSRASREETTKPIEEVVLIGGNASVRGLPEYLTAGIGIPVRVGNPFRNLAPFSEVVPPIDFEQSLRYTTAIGLALREFESYL